MYKILKSLVVSMTLIGATTSSYVSAETIRLVGPTGETIPAPQYSEQIQKAKPEAAPKVSGDPARYYGPTAKSETLWSIASKVRPSNQVTIQQTIYALYQLNPSAFESNNIHLLLPNSQLRIPSLAQVAANDTVQATTILKAHKAKLNKAQLKATPTKTASEKTAPSKVKAPSQPTTSVNKKPTSASKTAEKGAPSTASTQASNVNDKQMQLAAAQQQAAKLAEQLQQKLTVSESELLSLEERNHQLRLMLSDVQNEVESLKKEVSNEERIRAEVEKQLNEEKRRQEELQRLAPGQLDLMLANPWVVAALAILPALLVGLLVFLFKGRRKADSTSKQTEEQQPESSSKAPVVIGAAAGTAALVAEADDFDDDIFADLDDLDVDENNPEPELDDSQEDIFADLNDSDLNFNLDDGDSDPFASIDEQGDLNVDYVDLESSSNGISVNGGDKALGLEEMEQALSDVSVSTEDATQPQDIELDESAPVSQQDLDDLFSEISQPSLSSDNTDPELMLDDELDMPSFGQEDMDELLSETDFNLDDDLDLSSESDEQATAPQPPKPAETSGEQVSLGNEDIDDLFSQFASEATFEADNADPKQEAVLLDEMLEGDDFELSDLDDSELLLDEVLAESDVAEVPEDKLGLDNDAESDTQVDSAFDELIGVEEDDQYDIEVAEDSTELLDELLMEPAFSAKASADEQSVELDPFSSTQLLADDVVDDNDAVAGSDAIADSDAIVGSDVDNSDVENGETDDDRAAFKESHSDEQVSGSDIDARIESNSSMARENEPVVSGLESGDISDDEQADSSLVHDKGLELPEIGVIDQQQGAIDQQLGEFTADDDHSAEVDDDTHEIEASELDVESTIQAQSAAEEFADTPKDSASEASENSEVADAGAIHADDSASEGFQTDSGLSARENDATGAVSNDELAHIEDEALSAQHADVEGPAESQEPMSGEPSAVDELIASTEQLEAPDDFNFEPRIEGAEDHWDKNEEPVETSDTELAQMVANEFGVPQDEDWYVDEELNDQTAATATEEQDADDEPQAKDASDTLTAPDFDDSLLAEYGEQEALDDALLEEDIVVENALPDAQDEQPLELSDDDLPEYSEEDALADLSIESGVSEDIDYRTPQAIDPEDEQAKHQIPPIGEPVGEPLNHSEIDALADAFTMVDTSAYEQESQLTELLDDSEDSPNFSNISNVDADMAHSAGMDINAMLEGSNSVDAGEDWNGFKLTQEQQASISSDIPEDEAEVWQGQEIKGLSEPADEDWSTQDDLTDFDPKANQYMTIDELMNQADDGEPSNPDDEELMLDVGLDEFPDVIGPVSDVDVDSGAEAAGKLDLAKIYMEMNDIAGAQKLLEQAANQGSETIAKEAKQLLEQLST